MSSPPNSVKKIGLLSMVFLCLNGMVGSGLFLLPGQVAAIAGNWGLAIYILVAVIAMSLGWCYVKCASRFSRNGGAYIYAKEAFGEFVGFEIGLMRWVVGMIAWASLSVGFILALGSLYPQVMVAPLKQILIVSMIVGLGLVNIFGANAIKKFSNIITVTKAIIIFAFIAAGIFYIEPQHLSVFDESFPTDTLGHAALIIFFGFTGFEALTVVAAEMENPRKNIPLAMVIGILSCSLLYFIVQLICIGVLGDDLAHSASPIAAVAEVLFGHWGKILVSIGMLISIGGVIVVSSFITPHSCQALAEDHTIFLKFTKQNRFGAPYGAIIVSSLLTCAVALSGSFMELVTISVVSRFAQHIVTSLALFSLEKKGIMQPFSRPWKRAIPIIAIVSILWLLSNAELYHVIYGLGALVVGAPLYFIQKKLDIKPTEKNPVLSASSQLS
ncbi:MAG: amino acid permease [Parachlamydiaceae bacterium]|nr:amino acid permease [Parachlamydiaceae bacterium]